MKMKLSAKLFCLLMIFIIQNFSIVSLMANDNSIDWEVASESTGTPVSTTSESEKNLDKVFFLINNYYTSNLFIKYRIKLTHLTIRFLKLQLKL